MFTLLRKGDHFTDPRRGWAARILDSSFIKTLPSIPDAVMGVSFGAVGSLYAAMRFAQHFNRPLYLEFQDPCPRPGNALSSIENECLEQCFECCAGVITTTSSYATFLQKKYTRAAHKIFPIHMAYEETKAPSYPYRRGKFVSFLHAGALYGKGQRNADAFLYAMRRAFEKDRTLRDTCRFHLLGGWRGAGEARSLARRLGIADVVSTQNAVSYEQSIEAMDAADVLVAIKFQSEDYDMAVPGKLLQYFGRRKPILGIMRRCEAADLIAKSGLGCSFAHDQVEEIADFIIRCVRTPDMLRTDLKPNYAFIEQFSVRAMGRKLNSILEHRVSVKDQTTC